MTVVAEGIETETQTGHLTDNRPWQPWRQLPDERNTSPAESVLLMELLDKLKKIKALDYVFISAASPEILPIIFRVSKSRL